MDEDKLLSRASSESTRKELRDHYCALSYIPLIGYPWSEEDETRLCGQCWLCGFPLADLLQASYYGDTSRSEANPKHLAFLCLNCHRMLDTDYISDNIVERRRARLESGRNPVLGAMARLGLWLWRSGKRADWRKLMGNPTDAELSRRALKAAQPRRQTGIRAPVKGATGSSQTARGFSSFQSAPP